MHAISRAATLVLPLGLAVERSASAPITWEQYGMS